MSNDRMWTMAAIAGMVVIALGGWFLGISPVLTQTSAANAQTATIAASNTASVTKLANLKAQYTRLASEKKKLNKLRESIPEGANASAFLDEINTLSIQFGVKVDSVTVASSTIYESPAAAAGTTPATTSTSTDTPTPSPSATTTTPTPVVTTPAGTPLVLVPVVVVAEGPFDSLRDFMGAIQAGDRLYLATIGSITTDITSNNPPKASITGYLFTLKGTSDVPVVKSKILGATPSPTPTPTETSKSKSTATPTGTPPAG